MSDFILLVDLDGDSFYINRNLIQSIVQLSDPDIVRINVNDGYYDVKGSFYDVSSKII